MSTTETRTQNIPSMLNRHDAEIEAMVAQLGARYAQKRKDIQRQLAEMDRKVSLRAQMNVSLVGIHTHTLPQVIHEAIDHARTYAAPDTTPIAVYAIPGPLGSNRVQRIARTVLVADISDILPPER